MRARKEVDYVNPHFDLMGKTICSQHPTRKPWSQSVKNRRQPHPHQAKVVIERKAEAVRAVDRHLKLTSDSLLDWRRLFQKAT